ncbi:MAG TPA: hypothetical protein VHZ03_57900 [Trebonia sp.]|jgi:hypothetical protein|nr:hypothetical protein [Trebonia sp.]
MLDVPQADPVLVVSAQLNQALEQAECGTLAPDAWAALVRDQETLETNLEEQAEALSVRGDFGAAGQLYTIVAEFNDRMASIIGFLIDGPLTDDADPEELADFRLECQNLSTFAQAQGLLLTATAQRLSTSLADSEASAKEASRLFESLAQGSGPSVSASLALMAEGAQYVAVAMGQQLRFQYRDAARSYLRARRVTEKALEVAKADSDNAVNSPSAAAAGINSYRAAAEIAYFLANMADGDLEGAAKHAEKAVIFSAQDDPDLPLILCQAMRIDQCNAMALLAYVRAEVAANRYDWDEARRQIADADHQWHQVIMMALDMDIPQSGQMATAAQMASSQTVGIFRRRIDREKELHAEITKLRADNQTLHDKMFQLARDPKIQAEVVERMSSDRYDINRSQANVIGPNAVVSDTRMQQENSENALPGIDMTELARQLQVLTEKLKELAVDPDQYAALSEVSHAAQAASKQDKKGTLDHLKKAGAWALQVARDIGVQVAATALTAAL